MAIEKTIPESEETVVTTHYLTPEERARQEEWYREKQRLDEASALDSERRRGYEEGVKRGVLKTLIRLVRNGTLTLAQGAKEADMTLSEFEKLMESTPQGLTIRNPQTKTKDDHKTQEQTISDATEAIVTIHYLTPEERARQEEWYREKQRLDEASILYSEHRRGYVEGFVESFAKAYAEKCAKGRPDRYAEAHKDGVLCAYVRLVRKGMLPLSQGAKEADMTPSEFEKLMESTP